MRLQNEADEMGTDAGITIRKIDTEKEGGETTGRAEGENRKIEGGLQIEKEELLTIVPIGETINHKLRLNHLLMPQKLRPAAMKRKRQNAEGIENPKGGMVE